VGTMIEVGTFLHILVALVAEDRLESFVMVPRHPVLWNSFHYQAAVRGVRCKRATE
jgi:hypothetical protein